MTAGGADAGDEGDESGWQHDRVVTSTGVVVPVRATSRRPQWAELPEGVRALIESRLGSEVVSALSAGTGFTPGFASRLTLADGSSVFVKAASSAYDRVHGWPLSDAYREEVRKLALLPDGIGAPPLLWSEDCAVDGEQWIAVAFQNIDGRPPRRPWRQHQLDLVLDRIAAIAPLLRPAPTGLDLEPIGEHLAGNAEERLERIAPLEPDAAWLTAMSSLCADALAGAIAGDAVVHMDLREDNILIDSADQVWFVDWNWPVVGADWVDLVCLVLSAVGDGYDGESLLATHPLTRDVDPRAVNALLAVLWSFWAVGVLDPVPHGSPHLRDHQRWYLDTTRAWLERRLGGR
jgi:hypothetical protein